MVLSFQMGIFATHENISTRHFLYFLSLESDANWKLLLNSVYHAARAKVLLEEEEEEEICIIHKSSVLWLKCVYYFFYQLLGEHLGLEGFGESDYRMATN